jgi:flagellar biosynthesis/type III secretory pathway M-ring protein FliF/YscJ
MFEGLNWKAAARRSAIVIGIYIGLFYVLSVAFPKSFGLDSSAQVTSLLINALVFFFVFTFVYAFIERNRTRRLAETKNQQASKPSRPEGDPETPSAYKGRPNPNTSRKKTRRKR